MLSRLREAAEIGERDPKAAIAAYDKIAGETTGQRLISELASIRAGFLLIDTAKLNEMTERLEPLAQPSGAFRHTARELLALEVQETEIVGCRRMIHFGRGFQIFHGSIEIPRAPSSAEVEHGECEGRGRVAALGGQAVPFRRLLGIRRNAVALGVELAQKGHCLGIATLVGKAGRLVQSGAVVAALIGRERGG